MAAITQLTEAELRTICASYGLALETFQALPHLGTVNSTFRLRAGGRDWFLRVVEENSAEEIRKEDRLIAALAGQELPMVAARRTSTGDCLVPVRDKFAMLFAWVDGHEPTSFPPTVESGELAGQALGMLHAAANQIQLPPLAENRYTQRHLLDRIRTFTAREEFRTAAVELEKIISSYDPHAGDHLGLIHQDLFPDNILVDENLRIVALLDFEQATWGSQRYDVAVMFNAWCWSGRSFDGPCMHALLESYNAETNQNLLLEDLNKELVWAAARFTVTRITDIAMRPDTSAELQVKKDWRDYYARVEYWNRVR